MTQIGATWARNSRIILDGMAQSSPDRRSDEDQFYRDLDGGLVRLIEVRENLCTWVPVSETEKTRQVTHRDNFLRRFTPLRAYNDKNIA